MFVKVKEPMIFRFGTTNKCIVSLWQQQKWEVIINDGDIVTVGRGNVEFGISKEDFDKYFVEVRNER